MEVLKFFASHQVFTEGDAFLMVFHEAKDAIAFALELQEELLQAAWPPQLSNHYQCAYMARRDLSKNGRAPKHLFNGLRVRAAIHSGSPKSIEVRSIRLCSCALGATRPRDLRQVPQGDLLGNLAYLLYRRPKLVCPYLAKLYIQGPPSAISQSSKRHAGGMSMPRRARTRIRYTIQT